MITDEKKFTDIIGILAKSNIKDVDAMKISSYIQQLGKRIEELEFIVGLRQKRKLISKFDKEYNEEDKKKNPNRDYAGIMPDAEEVYKRYYKQKEVIEEVREYIKDTCYYSELENYSNMTDNEVKELLQILDKVKGE